MSQRRFDQIQQLKLDSEKLKLQIDLNEEEIKSLREELTNAKGSHDKAIEEHKSISDESKRKLMDELQSARDQVMLFKICVVTA